MYTVIATIVAPEKTVAADMLEMCHNIKDISGCRLSVLEDWVLDSNGGKSKISIEHRTFLLQAIELQIVPEKIFQQLLKDQRSGTRKEFTFFLFQHDRLLGFRVEEMKNGRIVEISPFMNVKAFARRFLIRQVVNHLNPHKHALWDDDE